MTKRALFAVIFVVFATVRSAAADVKVVDDCGHSVTLREPAQRVISMAPQITELLFAAGGGTHIAGVAASDYPEAAKRIPEVGDSYQIDIERVIALKPDLIMIWQHGTSLRQAEQLRRLGVPIFCIESRKLEDIPNAVALLGKLLGTDREAQSAASNIRQSLAELSRRYANRPPVRVFYQVWDKPLYTLSGQHIVEDAIRLCGGINIFAGLKNISPSVDIESVLQLNPEAIVGTAENESSNGLSNFWRPYPMLTAVRNNNIFTIDGSLLNRAGPRMIDGAAELCQRLEQARAHRIGHK